MKTIHEEDAASWEEFLTLRSRFGSHWFFRGQSSDWDLASSLERECKRAIGSVNLAPRIEQQLVRDFTRRYAGRDQERVGVDSLYCIALMQHYGAPTRLLDFTYSSYVAAYFAYESAVDECFVWCVNGRWCNETAIRIRPKLKVRYADARRNEESFKSCYLSGSPKRFVSPENPFYLNERLTIQQGVFLCPGDIGSPFGENVKAMNSWQSKDAVVKIRLKATPDVRNKALEDLYRMNVSRATLFPGLDGFAQSLRQRLLFYLQLANENAGQRPRRHRTS